LDFNTHIHRNVTAKLPVKLLIKQKCLFSKTDNRKIKQVLGGVTSGRGEDIWKGCRKMNMVEIFCTYV
jgi:hypothetical protein